MVDKTNLSDQEVKSPQVTTDNADLETANVAELLGVVSSAVNKLDGAGLEIVDGEVRVNSDVFDGNIEGLSNPMTADLDASGFNISNAGTIEGQALEADGAVIGDYYYASRFDGSTPTERLENALSASSSGDTIYLENVAYESDLVINDRVKLAGSYRGTLINGSDWTINSDRCQITSIRLFESDLIIDEGESNISSIEVRSRSAVIVNNDQNVLFGLLATGGRPKEVIFQEGTSENIIDASGGNGLSVTDNGDNTVGDIA